ncbi:MAG: dTMP kinase [Roseibacillus sp.]
MMKSEFPGSLIIFEGIDGTGKSTQLQLLAKVLEEQGEVVVTSREPTTGPFGQKLRASMSEGRLSPKEELALFHDDRRDHVEHLILPALAAGKVVLLDRYYFSTMAYQGARGFDPKKIREENESFAPIPDHVFLLEVPVEVALERIGDRDGSGNTFEQEENLCACDAIFKSIDEPYIHRVDANQAPEAIHTDILAHLNPPPKSS